MDIDDTFNEAYTFEQMRLAPSPMSEQPFASFMQMVREKEPKGTVASRFVPPPQQRFIPPPPKYTTNPEPQAKAPEAATQGEEPKTGKECHLVTYILRVL